jgi:hypothetical protein
MGRTDCEGIDQARAHERRRRNRRRLLADGPQTPILDDSAATKGTAQEAQPVARAKAQAEAANRTFPGRPLRPEHA